MIPSVSHIIPGDIGGRLRRAREQRGLSLRDAARRTKLSIAVLLAIERNDFESLPGGIYRKGYLRSLAAEVGLDPTAIAADYDREFGPVSNLAAAADGDGHRGIRQPAPSPRRSIATLVILIAIAMGWFTWPDDAEPTTPAATRSGELIAAQALLDAAAAFAATHRAPATEPTTFTQGDLPLRIELAATGWCWVTAESDGQRALYRLLEPGERVVLEGWRTISLRLGNAGSVALSVNDGPRRAAGGDGEVVDLKFTRDDLDPLRDRQVEAVSGD